MSTKKYRVAVLGATGAVGREMVSQLAERNFPLSQLRLLASERSEGENLDFGDDELRVEEVKAEAFAGIDIALFSAGGALSEKWAPIATAAGAVVIDNSSAFRMDPEVPLIVPEVNAEALKGWKTKRIIANPNCSTIQLVVALKPLHDAASLKRVVVATYQAVSGAGQKGIDELDQQVRDLFNMRDLNTDVFPMRIAFNCIPAIPHGPDAFFDDQDTVEERKMINETHKILGPEMGVAATCVRVPVFIGHGEVVNLEFKKPMNADQARDLLGAAPGVMVLDNPSKHLYPTPAALAGEDMVGVGRIRTDHSVANGLSMWVVSDNLRKGAALNAVQIAERLLEEYPEL